MRNSFGEMLRTLRKEKGYTQRELGERVGIDFTYVSKIETGKSNPPNREVLKKMADVLGIEEEEVFALAGLVSSIDLREAVSGDIRLGRVVQKLKGGEFSKEQIDELERVVGNGRA